MHNLNMSKKKHYLCEDGIEKYVTELIQAMSCLVFDNLWFLIFSSLALILLSKVYVLGHIHFCLPARHNLLQWSNSLPSGKFFMDFCRLLIFFKIDFFKKFFQEYHQSVKQFGSRSGPTFCPAWSGSKLFVKVISRRH